MLKKNKQIKQQTKPDQSRVSPHFKPAKWHAKGNSDFQSNIYSNFSALASSIQSYNWSLPIKYGVSSAKNTF